LALGLTQKISAMTFRIVNTRKLMVGGRELVQGELPLGPAPARTESRKIVGGDWGKMNLVRVQNIQPYGGTVANVLVEQVV